MFLISLHWLCMGMDEACTLVHALCSNSVSPVPWPLLHASMQINVLLCAWFHYTGCARAWMRHAPWYMPCVAAACLECHYFVACWMFQCHGWVRACTRHAAWHAASVCRVCRSLCCGRHRCWMLMPKVVICTNTQHTYAKWNNNLL